MGSGGGAEAKIKLFQNMVMLHMVANILSADTPLTPGLGSKSQTIYFFSESSHVAYQTKGN